MANVLYCPYSGTTKVDHLKEEFRALGVRLSAGQIEKIENACTKIRVQGERSTTDTLIYFGKFGDYP